MAAVTKKSGAGPTLDVAQVHYFTRADVARRLGIGLRTVDRILASRALVGIKFGRSVRVRADALASYCAQRERAAQ